jgi:hypothetical protein
VRTTKLTVPEPKETCEETEFENRQAQKEADQAGELATAWYSELVAFSSISLTFSSILVAFSSVSVGLFGAATTVTVIRGSAEMPTVVSLAGCLFTNIAGTSE